MSFKVSQSLVSVLLPLGMAGTLLAGCLGADHASLPSTRFELQGQVSLAGGIPVQGGGVRIRIQASGPAAIDGLTGALDGGRIVANPDRSACSLDVESGATVSGYSEVEDVTIERSGSWSALFDGAQGIFHSRSVPICMFDPTVAEPKSVRFAQEAEFTVQAFLPTTPEICHVYCADREADCSSRCEAEGAMLASAVVPVDLPSEEEQPSADPTRPGDPIFETGLAVASAREPLVLELLVNESVVNPAAHRVGGSVTGAVITSPISVTVSFEGVGTLEGRRRYRRDNSYSYSNGDACTIQADGVTRTLSATKVQQVRPSGEGVWRMDISEWDRGEVRESFSDYFYCEFPYSMDTPWGEARFDGAPLRASGTAEVLNPTLAECESFCPARVAGLCESYSDLAAKAYCQAEVLQGCVSQCTATGSKLVGDLHVESITDREVTANIVIDRVVLGNGSELADAALTALRPEPSTPLDYAALTTLSGAVGRVRISMNPGGETRCLQTDPYAGREFLVDNPITLGPCGAFLQTEFQMWEVIPRGTSVDGLPLVTLRSTLSEQCVRYRGDSGNLIHHLSVLTQRVCDSSRSDQIFAVRTGRTPGTVRLSPSSFSGRCYLGTTTRWEGVSRAGWRFDARDCAPVGPADEEWQFSVVDELTL